MVGRCPRYPLGVVKGAHFGVSVSRFPFFLCVCVSVHASRDRISRQGEKIYARKGHYLYCAGKDWCCAARQAHAILEGFLRVLLPLRRCRQLNDPWLYHSLASHPLAICVEGIIEIGL